VHVLNAERKRACPSKKARFLSIQQGEKKKEKKKEVQDKFWDRPGEKGVSVSDCKAYGWEKGKLETCSIEGRVGGEAFGITEGTRKTLLTEKKNGIGRRHPSQLLHKYGKKGGRRKRGENLGFSSGENVEVSGDFLGGKRGGDDKFLKADRSFGLKGRGKEGGGKRL